MIGILTCVVDPITKMLSPIGTIGEFCICGPTVGKGDVKSTSLDFTGDRPVFMTGDYARMLPDRNVDFIGRKDLSFFKVHGFRVNPREIEFIVTKYLGSKMDLVHVFSAKDRFDETIICLIYKPNDVGENDLNSEIRNIIKARLPYYMMPQIIKKVAAVPITKNGKTDLATLKQMCLEDQKIAQRFSENTSHNTSMTEVEKMLLKHLSNSLSSSSPIDVNTNFRDQGIHSLTLMKFANTLLNEKVSGFESVADLFDYPNIKLLAQKIESVSISPKSTMPNKEKRECEIAIVGVAFRLPKNVQTLAELWSIFETEKCLVDNFPGEREADFISRLDEQDFQAYKNEKRFKAAFLSSIDKFDNEFFGIPASEAKHLCPEHRLWMEVATEALLDSGLLSEVQGKKCGVFVAISHPEYEKIDRSNEAVAVVGREGSMITRRISYHYDLKGPAFIVDTACSSGLVAFHEACEAIRSGLCDSAIVGGVSIYLNSFQSGTHHENMGTISPEFCCRAFDEKANGTVAGEGVIALILEPLEKAIQDQRYIYGVVKGSAINNVGRSNGITAPSKSSQKEVIESALSDASILPSEIRVIETHGTGTELGDVIEIEALKSVFKENPNPVVLGASKANFGHLNHAAGLLGVLKVLSIFMFKEIPPTVNFEKPNRALINSNLVVPSDKTRIHEENLVAGVSAYGLSGTNVHCVLGNFSNHAK
ncbi:hypothetical protein B4U79_05665, partial [Dinothrombium tinctorium]